jgi:alanyl-tRNA synthetase
MALFGEKYDDRVRVLSMGDFSTELCGGTHASRTGDIGLFRIVSESGTAAGVRRIEAVTGEGAMASLHAQSDQLHDIAQLLKGDSQNLGEKVRCAGSHPSAGKRAAAAERAGCGAGERKPLQQSGRD